MAYTRVSQISNSLKTIGDIITRRKTTLCLKKTPPTFLAITRESIDGFFIILGRNVTEKASNHMLLHFPTSPN